MYYRSPASHAILPYHECLGDIWILFYLYKMGAEDWSEGPIYVVQ